MKKRILIPVCIGSCAVLLAGTVLGITAYNRANTYIEVSPAYELSTMYYEDMSSGEGFVTSSVSQEVYLMEQQLVKNVFVSTGDAVKIGDKLLEYDMTLTELDLSDKKIDLDKTNHRIDQIEAQLKQLRNGIVPTAPSAESKISSAGSWMFSPLIHQLVTEGEDSGESTGEPFPPETDPPETLPPETDPPETLPPETDPPETLPPETNPPETLAPETKETEETEESEDTRPLKELNWDTKIPDKKNPVIRVNSDTIITPEFIYKIMGFDKDGKHLDEEKIKKITLYLVDKDEWYTLDGKKLELPEGEPKETKVKEYIDNHNQFNIEKPGEDISGGDDFNIDDYDFYDDGDYYGGDSYTQEEINEMITERELDLKDLKLHAKRDLLAIKQLEDTLNHSIVTSTVNGTVKSVGDPQKGSQMGTPFMVVDSTEGLYLSSNLTEYQLDEVKIGDIATVTSWASGLTFVAEITEISSSPSSTQNYGNANVSMYNFKAYIGDSEGLSNREFVQISLNSENSDRASHLFIYKAYILQEDGRFYVYKRDENNRLTKQEVEVCGLLYGYYYEISDGLSEEDYIAFPYGKGLTEGAKTKEASQVLY